jgi:DNA-binding response OmpR family regulator
MTQLADKRVLVVEDHIIIAMDLAHELTSEGAKVVGPVATAAAALDVIGSRDLDGGILDIKLSDRSGIPGRRCSGRPPHPIRLRNRV